MVNARAKGQRGEREAIKFLQPYVDHVYGEGVFVLERNLDQWRAGGFDIHGLEWMALEVKRQESSYSTSWWQQAVKQARPGQVPVLMWRRNHQPWRFKTLAPVVTGGWATPALAIEMDVATFPSWFEFMLRWHKENSST